MGNSDPPFAGQPKIWVVVFLSTGLTVILLGQLLESLAFRFWHKNHLAEWTIPEIQPIDPNSATLAELELIPGLGQKRAGEIVEIRKTKKFKSLEDFRSIQGIGPKRLETLAHWLIFPDEKDGQKSAKAPNPPNLLAAPPQNGSQDEPEPKDFTFKKKVDPNKATREDLVAIPGIGPKLADKIMETREKGLFQSLDDLIRVPGIGKKNLKTLKQHFELAP